MSLALRNKQTLALIIIAFLTLAIITTVILSSVFHLNILHIFTSGTTGLVWWT